MFPRKFSAAALVAASLGWGSVGFAQEPAPSKDEALEKILEKLEEPKQADKGEAAKSEPAKKDDAKPKPAPKADSKPKQTGEVAPKDADLDDLLGKLGETKDDPETKGKPAPAPEGDAAPPKGDKKPVDDLKGNDKATDERLREITGRVKKKPPQDKGQGQGKPSPLDETVEKMREVQKRLSEPDTGAETRKKQEQIVKGLEGMLEQARMVQSKGKGQPRQMKMAGQQPGSQPGNQPGSQPGLGVKGVVPPKNLPTKSKSILALGKDAWGHLPPEMRTEMDNVFQEKALGGKEKLIEDYYLSVAKKSLSRGE